MSTSGHDARRARRPRQDPSVAALAASRARQGEQAPRRTSPRFPASTAPSTRPRGVAPGPGRDARRARPLGDPGPSRRVQHRRPRSQSHAPCRTSPRFPASTAPALTVTPRSRRPTGSRSGRHVAQCSIVRRGPAAQPVHLEKQKPVARAVPPGCPPSAKHNKTLCFLPVGRRSGSASSDARRSAIECTARSAATTARTAHPPTSL